MDKPEIEIANSKYVYAVRDKGGLSAVIVFAIFLAGGLWFLSVPIGLLIILIIVAGVILRVFAVKEYTHSVSLNPIEKKLELITKSHTSSQTEYFSFNELWFIYKKRADYFGQKSRVTSQKRDILLIDSKRKTLAFLVPKQDGWTPRLIFDLAKTMADLGIEQKVDKYDKNEIVLSPTSSP
ncbi:MAG: hypothetical protein JKY70_02480 [Mucilaginibacter sp.]|nr:hypothetical protein [Mucilaginibacter sp.]